MSTSDRFDRLTKARFALLSLSIVFSIAAIGLGLAAGDRIWPVLYGYTLGSSISEFTWCLTLSRFSETSATTEK
jgi:hypothetical protein